MSYENVKRGMNQFSKLVAAKEYAEADALVRRLGPEEGMTPHDFQYLSTKRERAAMRRWGKRRQRGLGSHKEGLASPDEDENFDDFFAAYQRAALWSSSDESTPEGGEPMDDNYDTGDFSEEADQRMLADARKFIKENHRAIESGPGDRETTFEEAGHDFWLTRNGHGAGFWDGDWPEPQAARLSKASEKFGEQYLYVGDDGKIYVG